MTYDIDQLRDKPEGNDKSMTPERRSTIEAHLEQHGMVPEEYAQELLAEIDRRGAALEKARAENALGANPNYGDWFYPGDECGSDYCEESAGDAARVAWDADNSSRVVEVSRAVRLPSVWVLITPDQEGDVSDTEAFSTKEAAFAKLKDQTP